jgi:hypothetical protein
MTLDLRARPRTILRPRIEVSRGIGAPAGSTSTTEHLQGTPS